MGYDGEEVASERASPPTASSLWKDDCNSRFSAGINERSLDEDAMEVLDMAGVTTTATCLLVMVRGGEEVGVKGVKVLSEPPRRWASSMLRSCPILIS